HSAVALAMQRLIPSAPFVYTLHHERDERLSRFYERFPDAVYVAISADQACREIALPRLEVIHHGLDPAAYACTRYPCDYVCFVGRLSEVKGPHAAIDVARLAGVPIRVAGEVHAPDQAFAERAVFPRLAQSHVTYLGPVDAAAKRALLRDARALLAPIMWNEPFGLILIEAMLSGCPPIAFRRGSAPELIEHGVTGFLADSAQEMATLLRTPGPLSSFDRRRCRERAIERFDVTRMVTEYERCYARAIDEHGDGRSADRRSVSVRIA
ncbi:MAG TPA: glycosyltransferase, partial [Gemmatimonadaceae bacterium]|nr:glycosyltransferase [Gemmatimonadaceae bacterium]